MLSGRGLGDELITRPEESYRLWRVVVCGIEKNLVNEEARAHWGVIAPREKKIIYIYIYTHIQDVPVGMCQTSGECSLS